jgi:hypothetical protein
VDQSTVDLIDTLKRIEAEATRAKHRLATGEAKNGVASLEKIRNEASDVLVRAGLSRRSPSELVS